MAARQHGLVTTNQLRSLGLGYSGISRRRDAGKLHQVHRGVYLVGSPWMPREARQHGAVLAVGQGAALTGLAGAIHRDV